MQERVQSRGPSQFATNSLRRPLVFHHATSLLTTRPAAPSQALLDNFQDPAKQPVRPAARFEDEADHDSFCDHTIRPSAFSTPSRHPPHSRESSGDKAIPLSSVLISPRAAGASSRQALGAVGDRTTDYSKPTVYGHHRQTSIVHGYQHSRNGSLSSMSSSPLSPQIIAAAGVGLDRSDAQAGASRLDMEASLPSRPGTSLAGPILAPMAALPMERSASAADASFLASTQRKPDRKHGKLRRDGSTHQSHSRTHKDDQKTVGEYAMHILFTAVSAESGMFARAEPLLTLGSSFN